MESKIVWVQKRKGALDLITTGGAGSSVCVPSCLPSLHTHSTRNWFTDESIENAQLGENKDSVGGGD